MDLTNLISYWSLSEASGTRADSHGSNTMTEAGTVGTATGLSYPLAANLTGANGFFIGDNPSLSVNGATQEYTICAAIKLGSKAGNQTVVGKGSFPDTSWYIKYILGSDRFEFGTLEGAGGLNPHTAVANNLGSPSIGVWYFIIAWRASDGVTNIQVNDGTVDVGGTNATCYDDIGEFDIGFTDGLGSNITGVAGPMLFWKRVLTSGEKTTLYNGGVPLTYAQMSSVPVVGTPFFTTIGAKRI